MSETMRFDEARRRLEEIVSEVRRKETSLERSVELLEEGVRLANVCTERIDETWASDEDAAGEEVQAPQEGEDQASVLE